MPNSSKKADAVDMKTPTRACNSSSSSNSVQSTPKGSCRQRQPRKRRRIEKESPQQRRTSLDSQLGDCNIEDAKEIDRRLRKVARANAISSEDMHKVVRRVVRNEHVLALVTLKAEDELAREKREAATANEEEQQQQRGAIIITETPSVPKLTRAKARELNRTPGITLPPLNETPLNEIEVLIREDLHSDEEDEEYTFKEDDFHSDEDTNNTTSDFDSNPCTPQTPLTANEESPVKFTSDGCFKLPPDKNAEDPRIATRTRSKFCLQQTTIEDLQSEFVPPDVEQSDAPEYDMTANDAEWMQFLTDFSKPLNNSFLGDDDDPINDPEYVAAEMVPVDAEELRDVNISKKELTDLVSELFAGLLQEGVSLDSIELETPQKFLNQSEAIPASPTSAPPAPVQLPLNPIEQVTRQIDFDVQGPAETADVTMANQSGLERFQPQVMSTPSTICGLVSVPIAENSLNGSHFDGSYTVVNIPSEAIGQHIPELIAVPVPGQRNCFQLAKVLPVDGECQAPISAPTVVPPTAPSPDPVSFHYPEPYDINFTCKYLSIRKHLHSEYEAYFESLRHVKPNPVEPASNAKGFTQLQHDLLQQQLRIHTQMLTQTFLQTYSHPLLYAMANKPRQMLQELQQHAVKDASFNCWNLNGAIELINKWEHDLSSDEYKEENQSMMRFIHKEAELTDGHTRQVPRLPPRIMDLMLDSKVFMYPQYLPRMAFQPRTVQFAAYAPSEYQLMAMGLEKYIKAIKCAEFPVRKGADPIRIACNRMVKDLIHGKQARRVFVKIQELCDMEQYNPVKYYFDHERAPPVNQTLIGFEGGIVRTPREQYDSLPSGWKYYIEKNWNNDKRARRSNHKQISSRSSSAASTSYLEFVREAVGEDLLLPDSLGEPSAPYGSVTSLAQSTTPSKTKAEEKSTSSSHRKRSRRSGEQSLSSLTINVNYVFGSDLGANAIKAGVSVPFQSTDYASNVANINSTLQPSSECSLLALPPPLPPLPKDAPPAVNLCFDAETESLKIVELEKSAEQKNEVLKTNSLSSSASSANRARCRIYKRLVVARQQRAHRSGSRYHALRQRLRRKLQRRCQTLITSYASYLQQQSELYAHSPPVQYYHRRFLALELYTQLLGDLKMFCETKSTPESTPQQKRQRSEEAARRANRQEEMLRHMLQPDSPEERNRKDATFAYNFYEKVEEALLSSNRMDDCHKFNHLLQTFDPKQDKVADLYLKVEKLLLPDYPELAEVFLNFLLPAEAAELGKYFEYFMITNASNFINKLNIYFCKQPAQVRKIYACLSELAELPSVSMKKVEAKILPLLKGNQFLCDWFVQQFPQAKPPKRVLPPAETMNLHEVLGNTSGSFAETIQDLQEDSPPQGKPPGCQLKYLNGRIFYGTRAMLPAKLSFRAASLYDEQCPEPLSSNVTCAHGVRAQGEKLISAAITVDSDDAAERSEEDDASRTLVIDTTTGDEENSSSSLDMCDDVALRAHAMRLNSSYYSSSYNNANSSTPNVGHHHGPHHAHAKKTAINFGETSPRRQTANNGSPLSGLSPLLGSSSGASPQQDKRKSPSKKVRSPSNQSQARPRYNVQPMVVIHEPAVRAPAPASPAIEFAKRLRTLISQDSSDTDTKADIQIIAQAKHPSTSVSAAKLELNSQDDKKPLADAADAGMESELSLSQQPFPAIKMDIEQSNDELTATPTSSGSTPQHVITTQFDSDEDCKLDVVASLANCAEEDTETETTSTNPKEDIFKPPPAPPSLTTAWTREEDKVILIEMKRGARDRQHLIKRIGAKLKNRNESEIRMRHQFLMDFLSKLQGK
ncbi:uncharacterized protein LOC108655014 isoform X2 [Drosophila navojoa]|uniref:uncharacterized protein LOC108655014 isoform X2 n=1 Tax=Drosophila navojoa TaxID=7232 RepID=UPI0011BF9A01|nr:uncharacterized protein LOC108655014 isoform X2 [Drosophila navojoa]